MLTRRLLLTSSAVALPAAMIGGCALFQQNANGSYGLSQAVITAIQTAVQAVAQYAPAIESIAATAASLFGAQYAAIVTLGSQAINQVIAALENLVANPPTAGGKLAYRRLGVPFPNTPLVGYTKNGIPVFAAS